MGYTLYFSLSSGREEFLGTGKMHQGKVLGSVAKYLPLCHVCHLSHIFAFLCQCIWLNLQSPLGFQGKEEQFWPQEGFEGP